MKNQCIIMMGVSGSGKSVVGVKLAEKMNYRFIEGDELHPESNVTKMHGGIALNDEDRMPWLQIVADTARASLKNGESCVIACSALKKIYRDKLRSAGNVLFIYLDGSFELMHGRMAKRKGHFMPQSLLKSQFDTLEKPGQNEPDAVNIALNGDDIDAVTEKCLQHIKSINAGAQKE